MPNQKGNSSLAYVKEQVGAFTVPGPHHRDGGSQDSFWPSTEVGSDLLASLATRDMAQQGRLYILADGVSLCADGKEASKLAVAATGDYFYQTANAYPNTDQGRMQRLEDAAWHAHQRVAAWDEKLFCWRSEAHADGVTHHFKREQIKSSQPPLCPLCNQPVVGLQTTLLAALVRGQQLMIVGIGDCSAFRLPANQDHGIEWIFPPQDAQFCGMPSLTRESIAGQSFIMTPGDSILLASDGLVKVLNGLHADANWHHMLRERLTDDYAAQVEETLLDLDGWRLSKPRQRKLHDDLTLVAIQLATDETIQTHKQAVFAAYDELVLRQQQGGLSLDEYRRFLHSAENALLADVDPQIQQLYGIGLHHFALADLANDTDPRSPRHALQLNAAALVGRRSTEWVTVQQQLAQLADTSVIAAADTDVLTQITSNLYSADWPSAPVTLLARIRAIVEKAANVVTDATPLTSFLGYLDAVNTMDRSLLPDRSTVESTSAEEENVRALELRVTQAISEGNWSEAQELIIELNKLKGATLNFDTEGVDTSPTRPVRPTPPVGQPVESGSKAVARVVQTNEGNELVVPFERVQRVFHSREPNALLRDAAHAAFSSKAEHFDLGMAADLLQEAAKLYPVSAISQTQWRALWTNPNADFQLVTSAESDLTFERLSAAISVARDLYLAVGDSLKTDAANLRKAEAKKQHAYIAQWEDVASDASLLPFRLGRGAWWRASSLLNARLLLPQARADGASDAAKQHASGLWEGFKAQHASDQLSPSRHQAAIDALGEAVTSKEAPWSESAYAIQAVLNESSAVARASFAGQLHSMSDAGSDAQQRLRLFQQHTIAAAWEQTFAQAEGRISFDNATTADTAIELPPGGPHIGRLKTIQALIAFMQVGSAGDDAVVSGFRAYALSSADQLNEADKARLARLRRDHVVAAWDETLALASLNRPYYLPPSGSEIGRIKPDKKSDSGKRLQAIRAMLPHLSQSYDNWLDYAAFIYQWRPPVNLPAEDQPKLAALRAQVVANAWTSILTALRGDVVQNFGITQVQAIHSLYQDIEPAAGDDATDKRIRALKQLLPTVLKLKARNETYVAKALAARTAYEQVALMLHDEDRHNLDAACDSRVETMWRFAVDAAAGSNGNVSGSQSADVIESELKAINAIGKLPKADSVWLASKHLLRVASERSAGEIERLTDETSQELFKAFRSLAIDEDPNAERRNRELYELSYHQLVEWKDSLPVQPGVLQRRRVNAEKRRIQEYWLLRKEYGM